jgi:hypothetical protein
MISIGDRIFTPFVENVVLAFPAEIVLGIEILLGAELAVRLLSVKCTPGFSDYELRIDVTSPLKLTFPKA